MRIYVISILVFVSFFQAFAKYRPHTRMYANDIPALQIVGVAMSESVENARWVIEEQGRKNTKLALNYPILVDAPSTLEGSGVSLDVGGIGRQAGADNEEDVWRDAWNTKAAGGFTWGSRIAQMYHVEHEQAVTVLILDRQRRIRAIANNFTMIGTLPDNRYTEVIEYLLLNIDGNESVPYDAAKMKRSELEEAVEGGLANSCHIWEYGAELQKRDKEKHGDALNVPGFKIKTLARVYPLLGRTAPDFTLPVYNGSGNTSLSKIADGRVTMLVLFWAGGDKQRMKSLMQTSLALNQMQFIDFLYNDWSLRQAAKGKKNLDSAKPFENTAQGLITIENIPLVFAGAPVAEAAAPVAESSQGEPVQQKPEAMQQQVAEETEPEPSTKAFPTSPEPPKAESKPPAASTREKDGDGRKFSFQGAIGTRQFFNDGYSETLDDKIGFPSGALAFGLKLDWHIKNMAALELSDISSIRNEGDFDEWSNNGSTTQHFHAISFSAKFNPGLVNRHIWPYLGYGVGIGITQAKVRDEPIGSMIPDTTEFFDYSIPDGPSFQHNLTIGSDFVFGALTLGFDFRMFFLSTTGNFDDDTPLVDGENYEVSLINDTWDWNNMCILFTLGLSF